MNPLPCRCCSGLQQFSSWTENKPQTPRGWEKVLIIIPTQTWLTPGRTSPEPAGPSRDEGWERGAAAGGSRPLPSGRRLRPCSAGLRAGRRPGRGRCLRGCGRRKGAEQGCRRPLPAGLPAPPLRACRTSPRPSPTRTLHSHYVHHAREMNGVSVTRGMQRM